MGVRLLWWNEIHRDTRASGVASAKLESRLVRRSCYVNHLTKRMRSRRSRRVEISETRQVGDLGRSQRD